MEKDFSNQYRFLIKPIGFIFFSSLVSLILMAVVYPDLLVFHKIVFSHQHDTEIPFLNTFSLISHYFNGGIQLWNRFDHMTFSFSQLSVGYYTLVNLLTAAVYVLFSPFIKYPGEALQSIHSLGYHAAAILIRTIGGYLLLRRFFTNHLIIFTTLIYLNTVLSTPLYLGLLTTSLYSLLPFLLYFILKFFEEWRLNDFLSAFLVMAMAVATSPLMALGYFYQVVHMFILTCLAFKLFPYLRQIGTKEKTSSPNKKGWNSGSFKNVILVLGLSFAILLPNFQMQKTLKEDFFIPKAFDKEAGGRMTDKFSIEKYFSVITPNVGAPDEFLTRSMDFEHNKYSQGWSFIGFSTLFLAGWGMIFSRDKRKHFFFWPILLIIFLHFPREPLAVSSFAHWLNVLTNPFYFLVRAIPMSGLLMPVLFLPLVGLGFFSIYELFQRKNPGSIYFNRLQMGFIFVLVTISLYLFSAPIKESGLVLITKCFLLIAAIVLLYVWSGWDRRESLYLTALAQNRNVLFKLVMAVFICVDLVFLSVYINNNQWSNVRVFAGKIDALNEPDLINPVYQNPEILPFREFHSTRKRELWVEKIGVDLYSLPNGQQPGGNASARDPEFVTGYRLNSQQNAYGLFYHYSPLGRYFLPATMYHPRHITFKDLDKDWESQNYLKRTQENFYVGNYLVDSRQMGALPEIKNFIFMDDIPKDAPYVFSNQNKGMLLMDGIELGPATKNHTLKSVWVPLSSVDKQSALLTVSAVNQFDQVVSESTVEAKFNPRDTTWLEFIFPHWVKISDKDDIRLILSTKEAPGSFRIEMLGSANPVYIENNQAIPQFQSYSFFLDQGDLRHFEKFLEYSFDLPSNFPSYLATTIFTKDRDKMKLYLGSHQFQPAQGKLARPFTFDIQNIATGKLSLLLPKAVDLPENEVVLTVQLPDYISRVWLNEHDNLGFNYNAPKDGWLVIHYPFDRRWRLHLDDKQVDIYRVNKYFIGIPVKQGEHKLLLQYWPDTILRETILISIFLSPLIFLSLAFIGLKKECLSREEA